MKSFGERIVREVLGTRYDRSFDACVFVTPAVYVISVLAMLASWKLRLPRGSTISPRFHDDDKPLVFAFPDTASLLSQLHQMITVRVLAQGSEQTMKLRNSNRRS
jgi:hypothetical protein